MNAPSPPLRIFAAATRPEHAAIAKGGELIRRALHEAGCATVGAIEVELGMPPAASIASGAPAGVPDIAIASPLAELVRPETPLPETWARWANYLRGLQDRGAAVFVCTVFRHVPRDIGPTPATREALVARIRRLNLLAIELSHRHAINVIDIDSRLAYHGARAVGGDFRLGGPLPVLMAGRAVAQALFAHGLDGFAPPAFQDKALAWLAAPETLPLLIEADKLARRNESATPPPTATGPIA